MKHTAERPISTTPRPSARRILFVMLALVGVGAGCKARKAAPAAPPPVAADSTRADSAAPAPVVAAAAPVIAAPADEGRSACDELRITDKSAAALVVGDPRDSVPMWCPVVSDSTTVDSLGRTLGNVVVGVGGTTMVAQIVDDRVSRLTLTDHNFRTADGLGPGTPVAQLMNMPGTTVLEGMHDLSIVVGAHCGLYFQFTKPAAPQNVERWADMMATLPPETSVERVVVHGCWGGAAP